MHVVAGTPPAVVTSSQVGAYAVTASRARAGWGTSDSVVWVVVLPPGSIADWEDENGVSKPKEKCGYQSYMRSGDRGYVIAEVDYPRPGCMFIKDDVRGSLSTIGGHEYVGAVTNPQLNGWYDGMGQHLPDLCRKRFIRGPGGEYVSQVWSNGDKRCVSSFTPRFAYRITGVRKPDGDNGPNSPYTRGHSYSAAIINAVNTGNMTWLAFGAKTTYLATADNGCSPFTDTGKASRWASCRRLYMSNRYVDPGESTQFTFSLRPDGSLVDGRRYEEAFTLIAGTTWMSNTGSTSARMTDMAMHTFAAANVASAPVGYVAVGQQGTDVKVPITLRNTGTATWFPNEVLTIGTPPGTASPYAARSWPKGPDGCRDCRAHRVTRLVPPGATYTFDLTLHLPANRKVGGVQTFYPFADVVRISDRATVPTQLKGGVFDVRVVVLPSPVGTHQVFGQGFADGGEPNAGTSGFSCVAVSNADAVSTGVTSCSVQVTTLAGQVFTASAGGSSTAGAVDVVAGLVPYDPAAGDTVVVCWAVTSTFLDGTKDDDTGCTR